MMYQNAARTSGFRRSGCVAMVFALLLQHACEATITANDIDFDSMPAIFGMTWTSNVEYQSHLQSLPARQFLCKSEDATARNQLMRLNNMSRRLRMQRNETRTPRKTDDGLPITLIISRGGCSFEEKARQAMLLENVAFVILYDDRERSQLLPMSASNSADIDVGLMFVSYSTGIRKLFDALARSFCLLGLTIHFPKNYFKCSVINRGTHGRMAALSSQWTAGCQNTRMDQDIATRKNGF